MFCDPLERLGRWAGVSAARDTLVKGNLGTRLGGLRACDGANASADHVVKTVIPAPAYVMLGQTAVGIQLLPLSSGCPVSSTPYPLRGRLRQAYQVRRDGGNIGVLKALLRFIEPAFFRYSQSTAHSACRS